ncbi:hypothetical protein BN1723_016199 [Verticillium longisporum]|uniref:Uncharacterized protein n=1 Tax=Verticillium longisporum TaxID=100787 RepID=A0A0G4NAJ5_VERLO|nr:hypothetical protein BN1723_016199 [Verticillium longisporum]
MDIDDEEMLWEGGDGKDASFLDSVLDSCLADALLARAHRASVNKAVSADHHVIWGRRRRRQTPPRRRTRIDPSEGVGGGGAWHQEEEEEEQEEEKGGPPSRLANPIRPALASLGPENKSP